MLRIRLGVLIGFVATASGVASAQGLGMQLIPETYAQRAGLTSAWFSRVQVDPRRGRVNGIVLQGNALFVSTDQGIVQSFDSESGRVLWTTQVGRPSYPTMTPAANDALVAVTNGSEIYVLDRRTGEFVWQEKLKGVPSAGAAASKDRAYIPMIDGSISSYKFVRTNYVDEHALIHFGKGLVTQPPIPYEKRLMWGTDAGYAFSENLQFTHQRFRLKTGAPIVAPLMHRAPALYVASKDGKLSAINDVSGFLFWEFQAGGPIVEQPVAVEDAVYVATDAGGMFRLDPKSGREVWWTPGIKKFVAASKVRIYAADYLGRLAVLDAATGAQLAVLPTESMDLKYCNTQTDRIILGTTTGLLQCLHERELTAPISHIPPPETKDAKSAKPATPAPAEATEAPATTPAPGNPFGQPAQP